MCKDYERTRPDDGREREAAEKRRAGVMGNCEAPRPVMSDADILAELFTYHPPNEFTAPRYQAINQAAKNFAEVVLQNCPPCVNRSAAIHTIIEAKMTANAGISLNGLSL